MFPFIGVRPLSCKACFTGWSGGYLCIFKVYIEPEYGAGIRIVTPQQEDPELRLGPLRVEFFLFSFSESGM